MTPGSSANTTPSCRVIRPGDAYEGKQGPRYSAGVSAESAGATGIWLGTITIAPGARTKAHFHERHETAIHVLSGQVEMWSGPDLAVHQVVGAGDYLYIPAGVSHVAANMSATEPVTAILARTDPNEQESVVLQPDLDALVPDSGAGPGRGATEGPVIPARGAAAGVPLGTRRSPGRAPARAQPIIQD